MLTNLKYGLGQISTTYIYRIERLLDPTTYIYASHMKPQTAMFLHIPANHVLLGYFARCSAPASMHARMLSTLYLLLLGLGYHIIIKIDVDDMIIIMLTIFDEGWKVGLSRLTFCSIRVT